MDLRREAMVSLRSDCLHARQAGYFEERNSTFLTNSRLELTPPANSEQRSLFLRRLR
jgi:hypothetical protein